MAEDIENVYWWTNGNVMVFDTSGDQVEGFQGRRDLVAQKIVDAATDATKFYYASWNDQDKKQITKGEFLLGVRNA